MIRALLITIVAAAFAGATNPEDDKAIRQAIADMTAAFNRHSTITPLVAEDADLVTVLGMWSKGAAEIDRNRRRRFETALKDASVTTLDVRVRFIKPDVAVAHVTQEMKGMLDSDGAKLPLHRELSTRVFVKKDGRWLLTAFQNTTVSLPD